MRLQGRVAIVTGGGKGIGKFYARGLAAEGARVVAADIDGAAAQAAGKEIAASGAEALAITVDVTDEESVGRMVQQTVERFGRVDVLVNNAALFAALAPHSIEEISVVEWDQVMAVNLRGLFLCSRAVLPQMRAQGGGSIINISSTTALNGGPGRMLHYVTSKAGVIGLTRALAREVGQFNIRVNALAPGATASETLLERIEMSFLEGRAALRCFKRVEKPEDLVGTIVFLASDESAFITGQLIAVDGGLDLH